VAVAAAVVAGSLALAVPAGAAPRPGAVARIDPPLVKPNAVYPVEPIVFPEASLDGAVVVSGSTIEMSADVMFDVDRAELTPRAHDELVRVVGELRAAAATKVDVVGYTDNVGTDAYNLRLSQARAASVRAELTAALGPAVPVGATGKGEAEPVADNATPAGRSLNRRVRITYS
jgi:outer membrane protein OmpA-like peptidoglycan-associated protein